MVRVGNTKTPSKGPPTKPKPNVNNKENKEPVEVFCRLRPLANFADLVVVQRFNDKLVKISDPKGNKDDICYNFKYVFNCDATQKDVFDRVAKPIVQDLIVNRQNGLLFTYGITSSGKTYTLTGNPKECGILPRCLDVLFNSIEEFQARKYTFKPNGQNFFEIQSSPDAIIEWQNEKIIPKTPTTPYYTRSARKTTIKKVVDEEWDNRLKETFQIENIDSNYAYSIFISHVEVYNNYIYDLLDDPLNDNGRFTPRTQPQSKLLREDARRRVYVQGGTEVEVRNTKEAFELFIKGIKRRTNAFTNLNNESSRSHSVFTIRLVSAPWDSTRTEVLQDPRFLCVNQLSLVDLAGSERTNRTKNFGERLKEAGNINNSLMGLRTCIEILRENQRTGQSKVVPYRDNKLTHLFKSYFEGEGKVGMIICVNPCAEEYDETLHVMKFAELSQDVMVNRADNVNPYYMMKRAETIPKYFGIDLATFNTYGPPLPNLSTLFEDPNESIFPEWFDCLAMRKKNKQDAIDHVKDYQIQFRSRISKLEKENVDYQNEIAKYKIDLEGREGQIKNMELKMTQTDRLQESYSKKVRDLERQANGLRGELEEERNRVQFLEDELKKKNELFRSKLESERNRLRRVFDEVLTEKQRELERQQCISKEKMHLVREILNADNTNWEFIKENRESLYQLAAPLFPSNDPSGSTVPLSQVSTTPMTEQVKSTTRKSETMTPKSTPKTKSAMSTPHALSLESGENAGIGGPPVVNPRHRRSLSTGTEKWIDHRPPGTLDLGTVLLPKIKNKKSVSNLKASDIMNSNASKYVLTHHEADQNGGVETNVFKGDVIPSCTGGRQVIFNDVETLKQGSPPGRKRTVSDTNVLSPRQYLTQADIHEHDIHNVNVTKRFRR